MRPIVCALLLITTAASAETAYHAIALRGGGHIVLRHGATARVDFVEGSAGYTHVAVEGGKLVVENCRDGCPHGYHMTLSVTAPDITALSVRDGGRIEALGEFPEQAALSAAVAEGGAIDIRAFAARDVTASVNEGGGIYTAPRANLTAAVSHGGHIAYWGSPTVRQSVSDGGAIAPGRPADAHKTLAELQPKLPPLPEPPAAPKLPPIPPLPEPPAAPKLPGRP